MTLYSKPDVIELSRQVAKRWPLVTLGAYNYEDTSMEDLCHYCASDRVAYPDPHRSDDISDAVCLHEPECEWMALTQLLGVPQPNHETAVPGTKRAVPPFAGVIYNISNMWGHRAASPQQRHWVERITEVADTDAIGRLVRRYGCYWRHEDGDVILAVYPTRQIAVLADDILNTEQPDRKAP